MKFAIVDGERREPSPGLSGICPGCSQPTLAKCGKEKVHHWAHKSKLDCDPWWENETDWHRNWKKIFPEPWQEIVHRSESGEFHRADVKTDKGWVLEFQYSAINPNERKSRIDFYEKIIWIVNGVRLKNDAKNFFNSLQLVKTIKDFVFRRVCDVTSNKSALLRHWTNNKSPIFFDFNEPDYLWCLLPQKTSAKTIVVEINRQRFIDLHLMHSTNQDLFGELLDFSSTATSAEDLFLKVHNFKRAIEREKQLAAEEAYRRNPYRNMRAKRRL
jgi:competence protein CoiA